MLLKKLRFGMVSAFVVFISLLFGLMILFDYISVLSTAKRTTKTALEQANKVAAAELYKVFEPANFLLENSAASFSEGTLKFDNHKTSNKLLISFMKHYPQVSSVNYGDAGGNGYLILRTAEGWKNRIKKDAEPGTVTWIDIDEIGRELSRVVKKDDYDPRTRPWYRNAVNKDGIQWSSPYIFRTTKDSGITASLKLEEPGRDRAAVLGIDIMLKDLSWFLSSIEKTWKGLTFHVLTEDGHVLACSDLTGIEGGAKNTADAVPHISSGEHKGVGAAVKYFKETRSGFISIEAEAEDFASIEVEGDVFFAEIQPFKLGQNTNLHILLLVPQQSLFVDFKKESQAKIFFFLAFLAVTGAFYAYRYLAPIEKIRKAVQRYDAGNLYEAENTERRDEVGALSRAFRDMVERLNKQTEELAVSEEKYRIFFESNPLPMWVYDLETLSFLAVNHAAVRHYGYSHEEFLSMTIKDIRPPEDVPALLDNISNVTEGMDEAGVWRHVKKDGSLIYVDITSFALVFAGRKAELVLANDVTERRKLEAQLLQSQKIEAVGQLAGGVAHDFNNILMAIMGYAGLMEMKLKKDDPLMHNVTQIIASSERAAKLVSSLLAFSRKQLIVPKPVKVNRILSDVENLITRLIREDIDIKINPASDGLTITADDILIGQALINLVTNARDAIPGRGVITINADEVVMDQGYVDAHGYGKPGKYALISVADTGVGMDEKVKDKIFEPFFTTKEVGKGTGLGLSMVYGTIKQHEGFINVYSEPGKGTIFKIYLPATKETMG